MGNSTSNSVCRMLICRENNDIQIIYDFIRNRLDQWYFLYSSNELKIPLKLQCNYIYDSKTKCNYPIKTFEQFLNNKIISNDTYIAIVNGRIVSYGKVIQAVIKLRIYKNEEPIVDKTIQYTETDSLLN